MKYFLSCDWGTSSFRLRLIEAASGTILAETLSAKGIAVTYDLWKAQDKIERLAFYRIYLLQQLSALEIKYGKVPTDIPLIISGMAASAVGMHELPYKQLPIKTIAEELITYITRTTEAFPYKTILVSGLRTVNDVMRGEETILAGRDLQNSDKHQLYIFPGTHSKHVIVQNAMINDFKTYMTGEVFQLLSSKSLLATSVKYQSTFENISSFEKGVIDAQQQIFLNNIFHVRTNALLNVLSKAENYMYLSGLVIGEELRSISNENYETINLVSSGELMKLYETALEALGYKNKLVFIDADKALINGQHKILKYIQ
jgi:2-dehydro-3-deoxygalactonokinase